MIAFLVFFLVVFSVGGFIAFLKKLKLEKTLPIAVAAIICFLFFFGLAGILQIGTYILLGLSACFSAIIVIRSVQTGRLKETASLFFTDGMLWLSVSLAVLAIGVIGKYYDQWDEFSHWGDVVKATTDLNGFSTNADSLSAFQTYPPGMTVFQYLLQRIHILLGGEFSEWRVYFAYNTFLLSFFAPVFSKLSIKKPLSSCAAVISVVLLPSFFYSKTYFSLYIDVAVACVFGYGLFVLADQEEDRNTGLLNICAVCFILPLMKDAGLFFAITLLILYTLIHGREKAGMLFVLLSIAIPVILWRANIRISGAIQPFQIKYDFVELLRVIVGRGSAFRRVVWEEYPKALINRTVSIGNTGLGINYLVLIAAIIALTQITFKKTEGEDRRNRAFRIGIPVIILLYCIGLEITYLFQFSEYEAMKLAAFERYIAVPFCGISFFLLSTWILRLSHSGKQYIIWILASIVLAAVPLNNVYHFISREAVSESVESRSRYLELTDKVHRNLSGKSEKEMIYIISQQDNGNDYWVLHYLFRPYKTAGGEGQLEGFEGYSGGGYSIGQPYYNGDVWSIDITPEELMNQWTERYDYVAVLKVNDYLIDQFSGLFDSEVKENTLWRIDKEERKVKLVE